MKTRTLVLIGLFSFVGFLLVSAPIATVWPRLATSQPSLNLSGLSGTVFEGSASAVGVQGRTLARPLSWTFSPWSLLAAQLGFQVAGTLEGLAFEGRVARTLGGEIVVDAMQGEGSLKGLLNLTGDSFLPIDGNVALTIDALRVAGNFPKKLVGNVQVSGLRWSLAKEPTLLGDLALAITTEADVIVARVSPVSGPLDVGGEIRVLADRSYEVDLKVKAKPDASVNVQNLVRTLGESDTEGYFRIKTRSQF